MTFNKIKKLISLGEGFTLEFKKSASANLGKELCAFANASGGTIFIGVDDKGKIVGINNHNKLKSEIQSTARAIEPAIIIDVKSFKDIVCITVPEQNGKPYSFAGKFFMREGASSQQLTRNETREFFFKEGIIRFDEMENDKFDFETDFTDELYALFSKKAKISDEIDKFTALENLHLIKNNRMTNAGAFLLAKDIRKFSISATAMCAVFMGKTKVKILDTRELTGDLYSIYQGIITYLQEKLNTEFIITGRGRIEKLELPEDALREAVVNALAHRNYRSNAIVQVHIFHDRVEIINPGGLPAGMTPELLEKKSIPRNILLFSIFHRIGMVEKLGSGIKRIKRLCKEAAINEPKIDIQENWFSIIFKRKKKKLLKRIEAKGPVEGPVEWSINLSKLQKTIIILLNKKAQSRDEILKTLNINISGYFKRTIKELINKGLIEYIVPKKNTQQSTKISNYGKCKTNN